ncbi:Zn-dependent oligopeptidase [Candidatus Dependentiae bacterium]|nr:Zn-dependent oligopeptidase [Candidatus Dependentiae bacterium]
MIPRITTAQQVSDLFVTTTQAIDALSKKALEQALQGLDQIYQVLESEQTFDNTARALDTVGTRFMIHSAVLQTIEMVHPDDTMRNAAHHATLKLQQFAVDNFSQNQKLYSALKSYNQKAQADTALTSEQRYFLQEEIDAYKRNGLHLDNQTQDRLKNIQKELGERALTFDRNISQDTRSTAVPKQDLTGLSEDFILGLSEDFDRNVILGTDYPTYFNVMENCSVEETRKKLWQTFVNRAYPTNEEELAQIIALRDEWAHAVGYNSFAHLDTANQMVQNPEKAEAFLYELIERCKEKVAQEMNELKSNLPEGVMLTAEGKFNPWDMAYVKSSYKKKYLAIDEAEIAQYFPLEHTLDMLLSIYSEFLGVTFKKEHLNTLWHEHVEYITVYNGQTLLGTLLLDLFPRPGKFTHACYMGVVPTITTVSGDYYPALGVVIANFPRPLPGVPSLLQRNDVITFFHEFGHALHGLLGSTELGAFSGTNVKRDFVEMPSQMLEEWMWDAQMLKRISKHNKTGEQLSDELIERILKLKNFDSGYWVQRQAYYSLLSLELFKAGAYKNVSEVAHTIFNQTFDDVAYYSENHDYASFGHLTGYGAKYYGYLWSKVFALDMFDTIKAMGLTNSKAGKKYIDTVLKPGGSKHPDELLKAFLGREPRTEPFFKNLGI